MPGSSTTPGRVGARDNAPIHVAFRDSEHVGTRDKSCFRGSMAGLCAPLPTLRRHPHGCPRTAWGRCGSLLLHRSGLAPPTLCRFRPAHQNFQLFEVIDHDVGRRPLAYGATVFEAAEIGRQITQPVMGLLQADLLLVSDEPNQPI